VTDPLDALRKACAEIAGCARHVSIDHGVVTRYAEQLPLDRPPLGDDRMEGSREELAAFWLTLDAINFGSGWFPILRKLPGRSG
jgi:hypothetical protein